MTRPSDKHYDALIEALQAASDEPGDGDDARLLRATTALQAVMQYLSADPDIQHSVPYTAQPLADLHAALVDTAAGRKAELFGRRASPGRPQRFDYNLRGILASAFDLLVRHGRSRSDAIAWLGPRLREFGIKATARQVARWRDEANSAAEGPEPMRAIFSELQAKYVRAKLTPADVEGSVRAALTLVARYN